MEAIKGEVLETTALAPIAQARGAVVVEWTEDRTQLLARTIAKGATPDELNLFIMVCKRTGLDPFTRQIYAMKRKEKDKDTGEWVERWSFQVSIDGMRLVAERTGEYEGQTPPEWCGQDAKWKEVWLEKGPPSAARVGVYRKGFKVPVYGVARFDAYAQRFKDGNLMAMWAKMPDVLIAKCAEALALRKGFPQELSGLYSQEEMANVDSQSHSSAPEAPRPSNVAAAPRAALPQAQSRPAVSAPNRTSDFAPNPATEIDGGAGENSAEAPTVKMISQAQAKRLFAISRAANWSDEELRTYIQMETGQASTSGIPWDKYDKMWKFIESHPVPAK